MKAITETISVVKSSTREFADLVPHMILKRPTWYQRAWGSSFFILLMVSDWLVLNLCVLLALMTLTGLSLTAIIGRSEYLFILVVANSVGLGSYIIHGIYRQVRQCSLPRQQAQRRKALFWEAVFFIVGVMLLGPQSLPRLFFLLFFAYHIPTHFFSFHALLSLNRYLTQKGWGVDRAVIVGTGESAAEVYYRLNSKPQLGYMVVGFIENCLERDSREQKLIVQQPLAGLESIEELIDTLSIDTVIVATSNVNPARYEGLKDVCEKKRVALRIVSPRIDNILQLDHVRDLTGVPLVTRKGWYRHNLYFVIKRVVDVIASALALLVLLPIFGIITLGIKLSNPGPIFFNQPRRLSSNGREIQFLKFRTMITNADELKYETLLDDNEADGILFKIKDDPRLFPFGAWLRRYSLDELPQLINVFLGQMSLVGPRPLPSKDYSMLNGDPCDECTFLEIRSHAKPGITGLWQISGRSNLNFSDMVLLDLYYIESCSIMFDFEILLETIPAVIFSRGAY